MRTIGTAKTVHLYGVAGCLLFRGCLSIEVNGMAVGTFKIVRYIVGVRYSGVSVKFHCTKTCAAILELTFGYKGCESEIMLSSHTVTKVLVLKVVW